MKDRKFFFSDKKFLRSLIAVALPLSLQFLISTSINMADTVMISSLGGAEIAAVGLVNQYVFFFTVIIFGVSSAGGVFFSQYFGNKDEENVRSYLSLIMQISAFVAIIFTLVSLLFPNQIMHVLIPDDEVKVYGVSYLTLVALTFIPNAMSMCFNAVLRSVNRVKEPLLASVLSFFVNIFFNYIFIFGKFGAPALGVAGAALGTIIARYFELILLVFFINRHNYDLFNVKPIKLFKVDLEKMKKFFPIATPIIMAEMFWSLGQLLFAMAYSRIGKDATAAIQLTGTIQNVFFIIVNSLNSSAAVIIGQNLGRSKQERVERYARYFIQLTIIIGLISLVTLSGFPHLLMKIYSGIEKNVYDISIRLLIIRGIFIPFRFINGMLIVGFFRSGGLTKKPLIFELSTMWLFAIPMSFIGVLVLNFPIEWVFTIVSLEEFFKVFFMIYLYQKKEWLNNITEN
ncbi:MATE family efflux transporter [uncultured Helcococcus sp.]|uniref:MATE family efflux transporter n=1 Tax=uncultured Helcococcus sp. TaxID=1072508 RepID=UPI00288C223F|nr:MATE family efflux transporter [uncultured Helcococcus sp.]